MQSTVNLKSNRTPITAPCVPAHRRDWMDDTDEELYRLKASKPHCNNHPCRSGCLQQWFQQFPQLFSRCSIKIADYHFKLAVWAFCKLKTATNPTIKIKSTFLTILCFQRENVLFFIFLLKKRRTKAQNKTLPPTSPQPFSPLPLRSNTKHAYNSRLTNWPSWNNVSWPHTEDSQSVLKQESPQRFLQECTDPEGPPPFLHQFLQYALHNGEIISWPPPPPPLSHHQLHLDGFFFFFFNLLRPSALAQMQTHNSEQENKGATQVQSSFVVITFP